MLSGAGTSCRLCLQEMTQAFGSTDHSFCPHCYNLLWPCAAGVRAQPEKRPCARTSSYISLQKMHEGHPPNVIHISIVLALINFMGRMYIRQKYP